MSSRSFGLLIIGLVIGGCGGYFSAGLNYSPLLESKSSELDELQNTYQDLLNAYESLNKQKGSLQSDYNSLMSQKNSIQRDYDRVLGYLKDLSSDVREMDHLLDIYGGTPDAFERVLNEDELEKIEETVRTITKGSQDNWYALGKIWDYVNNVDYAYDIDLPLIGTYHYVTYDGEETIVDFETYTRRNYIQTPEFTIEYGQGDCDDQAILVYAMIRYYNRNIFGTDYNLYYACIDFSDGSAHAAVFMPVEGGNLCILDPAGNYATTKYGSLTQKVASYELEQYDDHWSEQGGITNIELYWVDVRDGGYEKVAEGNLETISDFFEE